MINLTKTNFSAEVEAQKGLIVIDLWADWCGPCRMLAPTLDELERGAYSIPEPRADAEVFSHRRHALCIVPALAFDRRGFRLGYGGGYYDKFLKEFDGVSLGVTYDALIADKLPTGVYDVPVDVIITERRSIIPNAKK